MKRQVLVVADQPWLRARIARELGPFCDVVAIATRALARDRLRTLGSSLCAVVVDHGEQPNDEALALLHELRRKLPSSPRVLLSRSAPVEARLEGQARVFEALFTVPWPEGELLRLLRRLLEPVSPEGGHAPC